MGIYFNDKLLHPKKEGNELEKRYFSEMGEIDTMFEKNGTIVLTRDVDRVADSKNQSFRAVVPFALPTEVPLYLDTLGSISIRYSKAPPQKQGKNIVYPTYRNFMFERMILTEKNKDLAWFILKATNFIEGGDPSSKKVMRIYNPQKNVLDKASEVKRIAKVDALLMNEDSHVFNEDSLRTIADKFGIDTKDFGVEAAGFVIREAVIDADNNNNPDLNIKKLLEFVEKIAVVQKKELKQAKEAEENKDPDEPKEKYHSEEELSVMFQAELNALSVSLGTRKVPQCKKTEQIALILKAQVLKVEEINKM